MIKVYGSYKCKDCLEAFEVFAHYQIEYEFTEILDSTANLKEFLHLRDSSPSYDKVKEAGTIGIPTIIDEEGNIWIGWKKYIAHLGLEIIETNKTSCSITGEGC